MTQQMIHHDTFRHIVNQGYGVLAPGCPSCDPMLKFEVGDRVEVYDGDEREWVHCRIDSIGTEGLVACPEDGRCVPMRDLRLIYMVSPDLIPLMVRGPFA